MRKRILAVVLIAVLAIGIPVLVVAKGYKKQAGFTALYVIPSAKGIRVTDVHGVTHTFAAGQSAAYTESISANGAAIPNSLEVWSGTYVSGIIIGYFPQGQWASVSIAADEVIGD